MKNITILCFILFAGAVYAQHFEGTIQWTIKSEVTDPQMKAKMDAAQAKMNDPASQARMKEMQEKMNDPQMKAMMDANPQLKAQMEGMMKMAQGGDMNSMMPSGFVVKLKGLKSHTKIESGMMPMEIINDREKNTSYRIDRDAKTYSPITSRGMDAGEELAEYKVTKTAETTKILNYTCTKYLVSTTHEGKPVQNTFWTTTEIKDIDVKSMAQQSMSRGGQPLFYEGMEGVPLRMEIQTPEAKMRMEVTAIKREAVADDWFAIPTGFREIRSLR